MKINNNGNIVEEKISLEDMSAGAKQLEKAKQMTSEELTSLIDEIVEDSNALLESKDFVEGVRIILSNINKEKHLDYNKGLNVLLSKENTELWAEVQEFIRLVDVVRYNFYYDGNGSTHYAFETLMHESNNINKGEENE